MKQDKHILDSGAFSAFSGKNNNYDWDNYVKKYANFIIETGNKLFFELDIDNVVGLKKVEDYRKYLEDRTGRQPIPVWHANRGKDYYLKMCEEYPYVAIGTTGATEEGRRIRENPMILKWFIDEAHRQGSKIHGLGYTDTEMLKHLHFDSIDSTTWLGGGKYGTIYKFVEKQIESTKPPKGMRGKDYKRMHIYNFNEWLKFQRYAEQYL